MCLPAARPFALMVAITVVPAGTPSGDATDWHEDPRPLRPELTDVHRLAEHDLVQPTA